MTTLLNVHDYLGRRVTLSSRRWELHVLYKRPVMEPYVHLVRETISDPDRVHRDKEYPNRECHYLYCADRFITKLIKVVVEYNTPRAGWVVTVIPHGDYHTGEEVLWVK